MIFAAPAWLLALPALAAGTVLLWFWSQRLARRRLARFIGSDALPSVDRRLRALKFSVPALALALIAVALARPLTGPKPGHAERKGVDFVVALDVSKSMWAEDLTPNRLQAVQREFSLWLRQASADQVGLVVFAGEALIQAPVTFDFTTLQRVLAETGPGAISKGGTNIPAAIEMACELLDKSGVDTRAVVIFSDGENLEGDAIGAAREAFTKKGVTIVTVGVGTPAGAPVPVIDRAKYESQPADRRRPRTHMRTEYGTEVTSRLDEQALQAVATAGGGSYRRFVPDSGFLQRLRRETLLPLSKERESLNVHEYYEWFHVPLALALLVLALEPLVPVVKRRSDSRAVGVPVIRPETLSKPVNPDGPPAPRSRRVIALAGILLLAGQMGGGAAPADLQARVSRLLSEKKTDQAIELMSAEVAKSPEDLLLRFNLGLTLYQAGKLEEAIEVFQKLRNASADNAFRTRVLFQIGNLYFRLGEAARSNPTKAAQAMERALVVYEEQLAIEDSSAARKNQKVAQAALAQILDRMVVDALKQADAMAAADDRGRLNRTLQSALEAQERLTRLEPLPAHQQRLENIRQRLAESLMAEAARHSAEADRIEAEGSKEKEPQAQRRREQALETLAQADAHAPQDTRIDQAIQREKDKLADLITRRAAGYVEPALAQPKFNADTLERGRRELTRAVELSPAQERARKLKTETEARLEAEYLARAERIAAEIREKNDPRKNLALAKAGAEAFQKTLGVNAGNQQAKAGLEKMETMMSELHAKVAALDLASARQELAVSPEPDLKKAVGSLETATQNFARSLEMRPGVEQTEKEYDEAQQLLRETRDQLDQQRQLSAQTEEPQPQTPPGNGQPPQTQLYKRQRKPEDSVPRAGFWNRAVRDW